MKTRWKMSPANRVRSDSGLSRRAMKYDYIPPDEYQGEVKGDEDCRCPECLAKIDTGD